MERFIVGILVGAAIAVIERNAHYHAWLAGRSDRPMDHVPILQACYADTVLEMAELYALRDPVSTSHPS